MAERKVLILAPDLLSLVIEDRKSSTVRRGPRDIRPGDDLVLTNGEDQSVEALATDVTLKTMRDLTAADALRDGVNSVDELVRILYSFYPDLEPDETLTVIGFERRAQYRR
jgi:hypothetical protein